MILLKKVLNKNTSQVFTLAGVYEFKVNSVFATN